MEWTVFFVGISLFLGLEMEPLNNMFSIMCLIGLIGTMPCGIFSYHHCYNQGVIFNNFHRFKSYNLTFQNKVIVNFTLIMYSGREGTIMYTGREGTMD